jgi:hypothetical protein
MRTRPTVKRLPDPRGYGISVSTYFPEHAYTDLLAIMNAEDRTQAQVLRIAWELAFPELLRRNKLKPAKV